MRLLIPLDCSQLDVELGVYWINTWSKGALVKQKEEPIVARGSLNVDSYFGHSFLVVEDEVNRFDGLVLIHTKEHATSKAEANLLVVLGVVKTRVLSTR